MQDPVEPPALRVPVVRQPASTPPRLLDRVREAIRVRHLARNTERAYVHWVKRFILFHGRGHPGEMSEADVQAFLTSLAVQNHVAASTQNQALAALLFLYEHALGRPLNHMEGIVRARRPKRLPVVLTRTEVGLVLDGLSGRPWIVGMLLYGATGARTRGSGTQRPRNAPWGVRQKAACGRACMAVAVGVSVGTNVSGPCDGRTLPASRPRDRDSASGAHGCDSGWARQAGNVPHAPAFVRDSSLGGWLRHSHGAGTARAQRRQDHDDLHACPEPRRPRRSQSGRHARPAEAHTAGEVVDQWLIKGPQF